MQLTKVEKYLARNLSIFKLAAILLCRNKHQRFSNYNRQMLAVFISFRHMFGFWQTVRAILRSIAMLPSVVHAVLSPNSSKRRVHNVIAVYDRTMDDFYLEVKRIFQTPLQPAGLLSMSFKLQEQYKCKLQCSNICMLPSYNHKLPTGHERGTYLALDVGGSTFRVALVELKGQSDGDRTRIVKMRSFPIDNAVRALKGVKFFDWMAVQIAEMLSDPSVEDFIDDAILPMGLAWSFPIELVRRHLIVRMCN